MRPAVVGPKEPEAYPGGRFGRAGVVDDVVLGILGKSLTFVQTLFEFGMGDVPGHDDIAAEQQARGHGVSGQGGPDLIHGLVEIDGDYLALIRHDFGQEIDPDRFPIVPGRCPRK